MQSERIRSHFTRASRAGAVVVAATGVAVLIGWSFQIEVLKSIFPGLASMKPNAALAFVAAGLSLYLADRPHGGNGARAARTLAGVVFALGAVTVVEYRFALDFGIDELFFHDDPPVLEKARPGRMGPATAYSFCFVGMGLLLLHGRAGRPRRFLPWCPVPAMLAATLALLGYAYGVHSLYTFGPYTSMAAHTAVALLILSLSLIFADPAAGFMRIVASESQAGFVGRRLLLLIPVSIFALGRLQLAGEGAGWYDGHFGLALMVLVCMVFTSAVVLWHAELLYRVDVRRNRAEIEVAALAASLERKVQERTQELQRALDEVKQLHGLLPICAWCKKIRDDQDYWHSVETFITAHSNVRFSHGMCPECFALEQKKLDSDVP